MVVYENLFSSSVKMITAIINYLRTSQKSVLFLQNTKSWAGKIWVAAVLLCRVETQETRIDQKSDSGTWVELQLVRKAEKQRCKKSIVRTIMIK